MVYRLFGNTTHDQAVVGVDDEDKNADDIHILPGFTEEEVASAHAVV
ncbi:MAG TPA: hypothetical protein PK733_08740 [Clostridiales bacterium]|nr:hypothetical protein [Clostridiales bacterium]